MKCPTCGYIGFETTDRCRNCGYEFALATTAPAAPDLAIKSGGDAGGPLRELDMRPRGTASRAGRGHAPGQPRRTSIACCRISIA